MSCVYIVKSGEFMEVHGSLKNAYDAVISCFTTPVASTVVGDPGPDCWIEYDAPSFKECKSCMKAVQYYEVEEKDDSSIGYEIHKQEVLR